MYYKTHKLKRILFVFYICIIIGLSSKTFGASSILDVAKKGDVEKLKEFIKNGTDVNTKDKEGRTPLYIACDKDNTEVVRLLIQNGADVNIKDKKGITPLHLACVKGNVEIAQMLLQHGADFNARDNKNKTPFDIANAKRDVEIADLLEQTKTNKDWEEVKKEDTIDSYRHFLRKYPNSELASKARERIEEESVWNEAVLKNDLDLYQKYINAYPNGKYSKEAKIEELMWKNVQKQKNNIKPYREYLKNFPSGKYINEAQDCVHWAEAEEKLTPEAFQKYLSENPNGKFTSLAKKRLEPYPYTEESPQDIIDIINNITSFGKLFWKSREDRLGGCLEADSPVRLPFDGDVNYLGETVKFKGALILNITPEYTDDTQRHYVVIVNPEDLAECTIKGVVYIYKNEKWYFDSFVRIFQ